MEIEARTKGLSRPLSTVAERSPREGQVIARPVDEASSDTEVEQLARRIDPMTPADFELGFRKRRRALVLAYAAFMLRLVLWWAVAGCREAHPRRFHHLPSRLL